MTFFKKHIKIVLTLLSLFCLTTVLAFSYTMSQIYEASLAAAKHPLETVGNDFIFACAVFAMFFLVAVVIVLAWYSLAIPNKSRFGIIRATMLALPALITVLTCWGWMVFSWRAGDGADHYMQGQLQVASLVSGVIFAVTLPVVFLSGILRSVVAKIKRKMTPQTKKYWRFFLLLLSILFGLMAVAVLLFTLDTCNRLPHGYSGQVYTWWLDTAAVLHCCAALIAGVELCFGIVYIFSHKRHRIPLGSLLLSSSFMKYISIFGCVLAVMDAVYRTGFADAEIFELCALSIMLQCMFPVILYGILAISSFRSRRSTIT